MERRNRTTMIAAGAAALLVAGAAAIALLTSGNREGAEAPVQAEVVVVGSELPTEGGVDGKPAPGFSGVDYNGNPVSFTPGEDGPVVLVFAAHWCPHCQEEVPKIAEWLQSNEVGKVKFILISTAEDATRENYPASKWVAGLGWPGTHIVDDPENALLRAYGLQGFPGIAVVNPDGNMASRTVGVVENLDEKLTNYVSNLNAAP